MHEKSRSPSVGDYGSALPGSAGGDPHASGDVPLQNDSTRDFSEDVADISFPEDEAVPEDTALSEDENVPEDVTVPKDKDVCEDEAIPEEMEHESDPECPDDQTAAPPEPDEDEISFAVSPIRSKEGEEVEDEQVSALEAEEV